MFHHSPHSPSLLSTPPARALAPFLALGLALVLLVCHASPAWAEDSKAEDSPTSETSDGPQRLMLVIDASDSMAQTDVEGGSRMDAAKAATIDVIKGLDKNIDAGLIAYGSEESNAPDNRAKGCDDVPVLAGVGKPDVEQLETKINDLEPTGYTPIGRSLEKAAEKLGDSGKRSIILVSDGEDTCAPTTGLRGRQGARRRGCGPGRPHCWF
ncbi:VWA domain-containing protein [Corynebacterium urogenitale]